MVGKSQNSASGSNLIRWLTRNGWNVGIVVTLFLALATGSRFLGNIEERVNRVAESVGRLDYRLTTLNQTMDTKIEALDERLRSQLSAVEAAREKAINDIRASVQAQDDPVIFVKGRLTSGLDMGVNSSGGRTNWAKIDNASLCMTYPAGQQWGAVSITVGKPVQPPRPGRDFSSYHYLLIEARGDGVNEMLFVGLKDNTDRDDGSESKVLLRGLTQEWQTYEINLAQFPTADLTKLYVVTEFVFEGGAARKVCVRRIEFRP